MIQLQTNSLINIYKAISDFQQECPVIHKGTTGHNYTYADLPTILETIKPLLKKHNLGITQLLVEDGLRVMNEFQSFGSAITYYRRYSISAILFLVTDKDTDASGEKSASVFIKKHKSILDLTLAIDMCESVAELTKLHGLNKDLMNEGITALFTSKKTKL